MSLVLEIIGGVSIAFYLATVLYIILDIRSVSRRTHAAVLAPGVRAKAPPGFELPPRPSSATRADDHDEPTC